MNATADRDRRERHAEACRKSRTKMKSERADPAFVLESPKLSPVERDACREFLDDKPIVNLSATARDLLAKHLKASQTLYAHRCRTLIRRLESMAA